MIHECTSRWSLPVSCVHSCIGLGWTRRLEHVLPTRGSDGALGSLPLWHELRLVAHTIDHFWRGNNLALLLLNRLQHRIVLSHAICLLRPAVHKARERGIPAVVEWIQLPILAFVDLSHRLI